MPATLTIAPTQSRALRTLDNITAAAEQAIDLHGIERFTTQHVADLAGVSIGTVYRYFTDRVAILDYIRPNRHTALADANKTIAAAATRVETALAEVYRPGAPHPTYSSLVTTLEDVLKALGGVF